MVISGLSPLGYPQLGFQATSSQVLLPVQAAKAADGLSASAWESHGFSQLWEALFLTSNPGVEEQAQVPIIMLKLSLLQVGGGTNGT